MKNIKSSVFDALVAKFGADHVTDQYPTNWENLPAVQYTEEENNVYERTGEGEVKSYVRYRIDVWNSSSTSSNALSVDEALGAPTTVNNSLGLQRTSCQDVADAGSHLKHKQMRYEAVIETSGNNIYWT